MEKKNRKCIVKDHFYNIYYYGKDSYGSDSSKILVLDFEKLPDNIKNNPRNGIIPVNTEKGLELLIGEIENLQQRIKQEKDKDEVKRMKEGLERLYNSNPEMIDKYNSEDTKYPSISAFNPERRKLIIKKIVNGKI